MTTLTREQIDAMVKKLMPWSRQPATDTEALIARHFYVAGMRAAAEIAVPRAHTYASENAGSYRSFDAGAQQHSILIRAAADRIEREQA